MKKVFRVIAVLLVLVGGAIFVEERGSIEGRLPTVGLLQLVSHPALDDIKKGTIDALAEEGFIDGESMTLLFQNAEGDQNNLSTMSQMFVREDADVMIGIATPAVQALANASTNIPIVMGAVTDPVNAGLIEDLEHPGGNISGVSDRTPIKEQLDLMQEILPDVEKIGIIYSTAEDNSRKQSEQAAEYMQSIGIEPVVATISSTNDLAQVATQLLTQVDAVWVGTDNMIASAFPTLVEIANRTKTPIFPVVDTMVEQGGLATIGLNQYNLGYLTGKMTARVLKGEKINEMPVEFPSELDLIVNEVQANKLGIHLPDNVREKVKGE